MSKVTGTIAFEFFTNTDEQAKLSIINKTLLSLDNLPIPMIHSLLSELNENQISFLFSAEADHNDFFDNAHALLDKIETELINAAARIVVDFTEINAEFNRVGSWVLDGQAEPIEVDLNTDEVEYF